MAFNWQTFKTRTLTAIIFGAVMLTGLLWNRLSFFILFSIIHFGCWFEYLRLNEKIFKVQISKPAKYFLIDISYILFWLISYRNHSTIDFDISVGSFIINFQWLIFLLVIISIVAFIFFAKSISGKAKWMIAGGFVYISISLGLMVDLYRENAVPEQGSFYALQRSYFIPAAIIASIWINDTMAYIIGSLIGKTIISKISPKKTWEGTVGGIILSVVVVGLISFYNFHLNEFTVQIMFIALISSIIGTVGDFLESKLKRMAGVKDSGSFMPGHGGFLDRFDSMLLAIPAVWFYVYFFT